MYYTKTIDGVAIGSPFQPSLINTFLARHEQNYLDRGPLENKPLYY